MDPQTQENLDVPVDAPIGAPSPRKPHNTTSTAAFAGKSEAVEVDIRGKPAIRTMRSDVEELFKNNKPSLLQMIGNESSPPANAPAHRRRRGLTIAVIAIAAAIVVGGGVIILGLGSGSSEQPGTVGTVRRTPPPPYFATETARTITVKKQDRAQFLQLMDDSWREREREGTVKRIIVNLQDGPQERTTTLGDFFELWRIVPPTSLGQALDQNLMVFIYYGATGSRLGFAVRTREPERTFADMLVWEPSLLAGITQLFFDERPDTLIAPFEDRTWRNIDWRYLKLSQERDLGVGYAVFPVGNIFIFTTSKDAMETIINRLFDAR